MNNEIEELKIEGEEEKKKSKWEKFKEAWRDPKKHALIVLGIWGILFVLAIIFVNLNFSRTPVNTSTTSSNPLETFKDMRSYEFNYTAPDTVLNGVTYDNKYLLYVNNEKYYKNNVLYKIGDTIEAGVEPEILKINNQMIYDLINNIEPVEMEGYEEYIVPLITFMQVYENGVTDVNSNIIIDLYENDNKINKVVIDLTNYYTTKGITTDSYILTINYYNINNLSDFTSEYDEMIGVKE